MTRAQVGDAIPSLTLPPLSRGTLALYAGGSGDHVPLHIDAAFAKGPGIPTSSCMGCSALPTWSGP